MKRILVIGSGGAGKSTFSGRLSEATGIELIHLDCYFWQPNWKKLEKAEWHKLLTELMEKDSWIMDGNYDGSLEMRVQKCDTVFFLDLPRTICLRRVIKRAFKYRGTNRPDMAKGCNEKVDLEFFGWIWNYPNDDKLIIESVLKKHQDQVKLRRFKSSGEIERFFAGLESDDLKSETGIQIE